MVGYVILDRYTIMFVWMEEEYLLIHKGQDVSV